LSGNRGSKLAFQFKINAAGERAFRICTRIGRVSRESFFTKYEELSIIFEETSGRPPNPSTPPFQLIIRLAETDKLKI